MTGRTVFVLLSTFFGVIFAVNGVMIRAALSSFGGVETESSYKAGLAFKAEIAAAGAQAARHWRIDAHLAREDDGRTLLTVTASDAAGRPLAALEPSARFATRPTGVSTAPSLSPKRSRAGSKVQFKLPRAPGIW